MSDITRDDLWVNCNHSYCDGVDDEDAHRRLSDEEFDRLAREDGYVKLSDPVTADQLVMDAVVLFPAKVLRALLTDECETCEGDGQVAIDSWELHTCPDCGGRGWLPQDGVGERLGNRPAFVIPADWLEAEDE